jgi:hypothetical protein
MLATAPTTCNEVAALMNISLRAAWVAVWVLTSQHQAKTAGRIPKAEGGKGHGHNLYELTSAGQRALKRVAKKERAR